MIIYVDNAIFRVGENKDEHGCKMKYVSEYEEHLEWHEEDNRWYAETVEGEQIGFLQLENVGRHMHWCWHHADRMVSMSPGCLDEVRKKQKELFKFRKKQSLE